MQKRAGETIPLLKSFVGQYLSEVWLVVYAYAGEVQSWNKVMPEFVFQDGVMRVDVTQGDFLEICDDPWEDPFVYMSKENFDFVMKSGKYWKVDMSSETPYSEVIGSELEKMVLLENKFGDLAGVEFYFGGRVTTAFVGGDETWFYPVQCRGRLADMGYDTGKVITG